MLFALELVNPRWTVRILCIDMCMDMRVDMRIDMCTDVWLAMTVEWGMLLFAGVVNPR